MDGLNSFGIVPYSSFACFFPETVKNFELYRFVTGFLIPNPQPMQGLMEMYVMYTFSKGVETKKFGRNLPDYFFYLAIIFPLMLFGAYFFLPPVLSLSPALQSALTYTWAIDNYDQKVNFYFIPLQASLLPVVSLGFRILVDGQLSFLLALIGMSAAYIYNCIETHSFGPLESFFFARQGNATNRHGAGNNILRWVYSTGKLQAPQWLRTIFSTLTGNDYNSAPLGEFMLLHHLNKNHLVVDSIEKRGLSREKEEDLERKRIDCGINAYCAKRDN